ncbi:hypothetical protein SpCBS45565_g01838 [Spizellomyces sp. 'palustris']|nr:hypothetical protein SpCBS45565_g01838 [Spizellomyces sp. 'palustris']
MSVGDPTVSPFLDAFKFLETVEKDLGDDNLFTQFLELLPVFATHAAKENEELQTQLAPAIHPFLANSSSAIFAAFETLADLIKHQPGFSDGFTRLVESYWVQAHVRAILASAGFGDDVFGGYIKALQLGAQNAEHQDIMRRIWNWFEANVDARTLGRLRIAFLQEEVAQSMGMDFETMAKAQTTIADDELYHDVLNYLVMSQSQNISWYQIFDMIRSVVLRRKPTIWEELDGMLSDWRIASAEEFLSKARDIIEDDEFYAEFSAQYIADSEETMNSLETITDDDLLVDQLKKLQLSAAPPRPQGPRRPVI